MTTVNTLVLISNEQRAHISRIAPRHPGRSCARAIRLGFEFMHTPIKDFATITFVLDPTLRYTPDTALCRSLRLKWDPAGEEVPVPLERDQLDAAVKHFTALDLDPLIGFSICLWYGLLAYHCKIRSLREAIWHNYPRRSDELMAKLLSDGKTFAGMAYLAGTAGGREHCETCAFYQTRTGKTGQELDGSCDKYATVIGTGPVPRFPSYALACKYHEEKDDEKS